MLEVYQAYTDYDRMAELTRTLYQTVARDVFGSTTLRLADGSEYEIGGEWAQISLFEHLVVPDLHAPTFVKDFPVDTSPLTREHRSAAGLAELRAW